MSEGHAPITGLSFTVTLKVQVDEPQVFVAVQVTVVVPVENVEPEAGEQDTVGVGVPLAVGAEYVTTGLHVVISEGHAPITGLSLTVTLNVHVEEPQPLVAVHVTVVVPAENTEPDAGEQVTTGDVPVAVGSVHVGVLSSHWVMSDGHAPMTGGTQFTISQYTPEYPGGQSQPQNWLTVPPF